MKFFTGINLLFLALILFSCNNDPGSDKKQDSTARVPLDPEKFTDSVGGKSTRLFTLKSSAGLVATFTNYGGRLVSLHVPDKNGKLTDVVVGFDNVQDYVNSPEPFFGATIGRYGNRIAKARFSLDGKEYLLDVNNGPNTLHGGKKGFHNVVWTATQPNDSTIEFKYLSPDMEEGFPGNLNASVTYTLAGYDFKMDYFATTDKRTVINITNHAFFNLN